LWMLSLILAAGRHPGLSPDLVHMLTDIHGLQV
jgi:hypothetical protein